MTAMKRFWLKFCEEHPTSAQFITFFVLSNMMTILQFVMMALFKWLFGMTHLAEINFQFGQVGQNFDGSIYYIFNYASGAINKGGGGGFAYFLAVEVSMGIAQIINFFAQRHVTFKAKGSVLKAATWYFIAYLFITISAAALQGFYKAPVYHFFMESMNLGATGETVADFTTMVINSAISFWIFFPIFKVIFKE